MKISHKDKQFAASRVLQATASKRHAGDVFRQRYLDQSIKKALKFVHEKEISPNPPSPKSHGATQALGADSTS